jgi:TolB-like protein/Tfp pilus assembly protein PilF
VQDFFAELKRRNVAKVALVYVIAGWLTMQVVDVMFPALRLPDWLTSATAAFLIIGFPFALIFAWAFELTPEGIKREKDVDRSESITPQTGQKLNHTAVIILTIAVAFLLVDKFVLDQDTAQSDPPVAAAPEEKPSIAVLPFVNMSDDRENEYFSDGLAEELLNLLAKIPQLHVAGRTSSFKFKGTNEDLRVIGQALNVRHVLEGSVRKSGVRLRITAQLIDTDNGYHLWSDTYDRDLTDIFAIQDEIAGHVVEELKAHLLGAEVTTAMQGTTNADAYNDYLLGNYFLQRTSQDNLSRAVDAYENAIRKDPGFARAYAALAIAQQQDFGGWASSSGGGFIEKFAILRENVDKAMSLAPDDPDVLMAKSMAALTVDWDLPGAIAVTERTVEIDPNNAVVLEWHGSNLAFTGRYAEAEQAASKAVALDPLSVSALRNLGDIYMVSGRCDQALETYQRALSMSPDSGRFFERMARCKLFEGDLEAAKAFNAKEPVDWVRETNNLIIMGRENPGPEWEAAVTAYETQYGYGNSYQMAEIYADAGDLDKAFEWLDHAARVRDPGGPWALVIPFFEEAWEDPRFDEYRARFGL